MSKVANTEFPEGVEVKAKKGRAKKAFNGNGTTETKPKTKRKVSNLRRRVKKENLVFGEDQLYAYKVMKRMGNGLLHSGSVPVGSKLHKTYQEGQMTGVSDEMFEAGFGICVFKDLSCARCWNGANPGDKEIWKVAVGAIKEPAPKRPSISNLVEVAPKNKMAKANYRQVLKAINHSLTRSSWPAGAMVADWVIPVERVY